METIRRQAQECANRLLPVAHSAGTAELFLECMDLVVDLAIATKCNYARNSGDPGYGILFEARGGDNAGQFTFFAKRRNADRGIVTLAISDAANEDRAPELRDLVQDLCRHPGIATSATGKNSWPAIGFTNAAAGKQIVEAVSHFLLNKKPVVRPSPESTTDPVVLGAIQSRRGQPEFRQRLLAAYEGRCAITGCNVAEALEAAHIVPYAADGTYATSNGLLMRADIHTLFDLHLLSICPDNKAVRLPPPAYSPPMVSWKVKCFVCRFIKLTSRLEMDLLFISLFGRLCCRSSLNANFYDANRMSSIIRVLDSAGDKIEAFCLSM